MRKSIIIIAVFLFAGSSFAQNIVDRDIIKTGQKCPDFVYFNEKGDSIRLSDFLGKIILINFFATRCGPCILEFKDLQETIWKNYKDNSNFKLIVIARNQTKKDINKFRKIFPQFDFPIIPEGRLRIYEKFATELIPRNYIVDTSGIIVYASHGYYKQNFENLYEFLQGLLESKPAK